jgi:kumamolisin
MSAKFVPLGDSNRPKKADAKRVRDADPKRQIEVTISLRGPKLPEPGSTSGPALSREEYASKFGANRQDADTVAQVLQGYGLKVEDISLPTRSMRVTGTVAAMQSAFQTKLGIYHSKEQGDFRGREGMLQVPSELGGIVTGVFGLDERQVARRKLKKRPALKARGKAVVRRTKTKAAPKKKKKSTKAGKLSPLGPADLAARYNFPAGQGNGQQIGIAEFGGAYFPADLQKYCSKFNLPVPSVTVVPVGLNSGQTALDASGEVNMDVQVIAGLCPQADIFMYFAPFSQKGWVDLLNKVLSGVPAKPVTLSISWGLAEDNQDWSEAARTQINDRLQALALIGVTVCISSGDDGSGDEETDGKAHVDFPGSSPFVLCVGGTMITGSAANPTEQTWFEAPGVRSGGGGATGGGVSVFFPRPSWQNVTIPSLNRGSIDGRVVPDISALAGPPLYDLILQGKDAPNGGTSASAPLWAALLARINAALPASKQQRFITPLLYQNGSNGQPRGADGCNDIAVGQNASSPQPGVGYQAKAGFDAVTGWGTPNGAKLLTALSS